MQKKKEKKEKTKNKDGTPDKDEAQPGDEGLVNSSEEESSSSESEGDGPPGDGSTGSCLYVARAKKVPHSLQVGRFLNIVAQKRMQQVCDLAVRTNTADSGMASATSTGQRPNG